MSNTQQAASVRTGVEIKVHCANCSTAMKDMRVPQCDLEGNKGKLFRKPTKSSGNSHHITSQLALENSLIIANEHRLCCRAWLAVEGV